MKPSGCWEALLSLPAAALHLVVGPCALAACGLGAPWSGHQSWEGQRTPGKEILVQSHPFYRLENGGSGNLNDLLVRITLIDWWPLLQTGAREGRTPPKSHR